jgi:elongation factor G
MGELHLDIKVDYSQAHPQGRGRVSALRRSPIARRSRSRSTIDYTHKKQTGGTGQFARVKLMIEPNEAGKGYEFESKIVGGAVPKEYIPGVEKGLNSRFWARRSLRGLPGRRRARSTLIDGAYPRRELLRARLRNRAPARPSAKRLQKGGCGSARADHEGRGRDARGVRRLGHRRSQLASRPDPVGQDMRGNAVVINAMVPLANMFGYVNNLPFDHAGRATYTMQFDHYAQVPAHRRREIQAKYA